MQITYLQLWAMVLFVMQCILFFLPASVEWWMRWMPALMACVFVALSLIGAAILFVFHMVRGFMIGIKMRRELLKIPEKE